MIFRIIIVHSKNYIPPGSDRPSSQPLKNVLDYHSPLDRATHMAMVLERDPLAKIGLRDIVDKNDTPPRGEEHWYDLKGASK